MFVFENPGLPRKSRITQSLFGGLQIILPGAGRPTGGASDGQYVSQTPPICRRPDDERELPFFFQKPADAIVHDGAVVLYPSCTSDFQHEVELVLCIGEEGADIPVEQAGRHVLAVGAGIDLTRRDVEVQARKIWRRSHAGEPPH